MGRPSKEPPSPSALVPAIVRYARAHAFDVAALALRFGFAPTFGEREDVNVAADTPNELLDAIARTRPDVALELALDLPSRHHPLVSVAARSSATARDALLLLGRWTRLLHEGFEAALEEGPDEARWIVRTPRRPRGLGQHVQELALAYALCRVREGGGEDLAPTRVWFAHARPPDLRTRIQLFTVSDLGFGHETSGMSFSPAALERPMRLADAKTAAAVASIVDLGLPVATRPSFAERVGAQIGSSLPRGSEATEVARALHLSPRTLQRRLLQEQTSFTEVLDGVRLARSCRLLANASLSVGEVAMQVGFADVATFSRAFKRWTGRPRGQWRRS